jgi:hypothetical protein
VIGETGRIGRIFLGMAKNLLDHSLGLGAVATAKEVEVIQNMIEIVEGFSVRIA